MASWRYVPLAVILITICLDISSVVVVVTAAATVAWNPKTSSRYDSYNLDKGPVFYKAYYPNIPDAYPEKRYFDQNAVLETSFQVPFEHFAYSTEIVDRPILNNESLVVTGNEETLLEQRKRRERRKAIEYRRNYEDAANKFASFHDVRSTTFNNDENPRAANIEEISELVRRAISRDLENWNALERSLNGNTNRDRPIPSQSKVYSTKNRENKESDSYMPEIHRKSFDSSKQPSLEILGKLKARDVKRQPTYFEEIGTSASTMTNEMSASDTQIIVNTPPPIGIISNSLPVENIFQPRPQLIRYMFFKKSTPRHNERRIQEVIDQGDMPRNYSDNIIREKITDKSRGKQTETNIKVTSIEVSKLPRHKTRHRHGEWPKRDYSAHRRRLQPTSYPII